MDTAIFNGCLPAIMTPCNDDRNPDFDALVKKALELVDAGMNGVIYCGSMGDWPLLTDDQRMMVCKISMVLISFRFLPDATISGTIRRDYILYLQDEENR